MPPELGNLTGLRMFEAAWLPCIGALERWSSSTRQAFENGKLGHDEEEHACPGQTLLSCIPGEGRNGTCVWRNSFVRQTTSPNMSCMDDRQFSCRVALSSTFRER